MIRYARSGELHVAYDVQGAGDDDLLVVSDGFLPIDTMDDEPSLARALRRLASFSRLIRFDRRGVGLSDPVSPSAPPSVEDWMRDAVAVLDAAGSARASVLGSAETAAIAMLLAASHPERVRALVLVNCSARMGRAPDYPIGFSPEELSTLVDGFTDPDPDAEALDVLRTVAPSVADDPQFRDWWERAGHRGASPATARALMRVAFESDLRPALSSITAPTLVLYRRDHPALPVELPRYLAEHIPGARFVEVPGADDLWWVGEADALLDEIEEFLTGTRPGVEPDRVLATVLFTDIVESTRRAADLGDRRWRDLLDAHDSVVRRQLDRFGGRELKVMGDGFLALFDGPARAVRCAGAIRDAAGQLGLEVRAGVHTGEVEIRGDDVAGIAVHIASRVSAAAGPGEVVVSRTVTDLVAGSGIEFDDRGERELKGVPGAWRLYAVVE